MENISSAPHGNSRLREFLFIVVPAIALAGFIITISHLWDENTALKEALSAEMHKSIQAGESAHNYLYLLDTYPNATRMDAYVQSAIDVPTQINKPSTISLPITWHGERCELSSLAFGLMANESVFIKPQQVSCGDRVFKVSGMVFRDQARMAHGELMTVPDSNGGLQPIIRLQKGMPLEAWLRQQ